MICAGADYSTITYKLQFCHTESGSYITLSWFHFQCFFSLYLQLRLD